jgi:hypothetical protein
MAIQFHTEQFEFSHGRKPKGHGSWAFVRRASHNQSEQTMFAPRNMTFAEARTWCRRTLFQQGWQDAHVDVGA